MSDPTMLPSSGAGPVGLATAAHVLERRMKPIVPEAGDSVAHTVRQLCHAQFRSPWAYNIDCAAERLLRSIAADIAGDEAAAGRVELVLPETGVCTRAAAPDSAGSCCGGPAPSDVDACCADDAKAKQQGKAGCGCG